MARTLSRSGLRAPAGSLRGRGPGLCPPRRHLSPDRAGSLIGRLRRRQTGSIGVRDVAIKVESIAAFSRAHDLGLEILGYALGPYRSAARSRGDRTNLVVVERRGYLGFEPFPGELAREGRMKPHAARDALAARDRLAGPQTPV